MLSFALSQAELSNAAKPSVAPVKTLTSKHNAPQEVQAMFAKQADSKAGIKFEKFAEDVAAYCLKLLNLAEPSHVSSALDNLSATDRELLLGYWQSSKNYRYHSLYVYFQPCSEWPTEWKASIATTLKEISIPEAKYLIPALKVKYCLYLKCNDAKLVKECYQLMHDAKDPLWHLNLADEHANIEALPLVDAKIPGVNFSHSSLHNACFDGADISYSSLRNTNPQIATFHMSNRRGCNIDGMQYNDSSLAGFTDGELKHYFESRATDKCFEPLQKYFYNHAYFCGLFKYPAPRAEYLAAIYLLNHLHHDAQPYSDDVSNGFLSVVSDAKDTLKAMKTMGKKIQ